MPQYHVGHLERIDRIARAVARLPRLALAGNAYRGVGIPDCIHSGETAAEAIMQALIGRETVDPPKRRLETTDEPSPARGRNQRGE
jgi:oxygen-dependent protoporphyrinogen oxidase